MSETRSVFLHGKPTVYKMKLVEGNANTIYKSDQSIYSCHGKGSSLFIRPVK